MDMEDRHHPPSEGSMGASSRKRRRGGKKKRVHWSASEEIHHLSPRSLHFDSDPHPLPVSDPDPDPDPAPAPAPARTPAPPRGAASSSCWRRRIGPLSSSCCLSPLHSLPQSPIYERSRSRKVPNKKICILNLSLEVTLEEMKALFSRIGELKDCSIHYDAFGDPMGTGSVEYVREQDALTAAEQLNDVNLHGHPIQLVQL